MTDIMRQPLFAWRSDDVGQTYTLTLGACHAKVSGSASAGWAAFISHTRASIGQHSFTTREHAQAWCEQHLLDLIADGRCTLGAPQRRHND